MGQEVDFKLVDLREGRSDTDYRVLNGRGRGIFRLNIKFFGSTFRRGAELVGLEPEDCFQLATYKILSAVEKQTAEHLPFVFTVVGVPNLTAISMRNYFSEDDITMIALITAPRPRMSAAVAGSSMRAVASLEAGGISRGAARYLQPSARRSPTIVASDRLQRAKATTLFAKLGAFGLWARRLSRFGPLLGRCSTGERYIPARSSSSKRCTGPTWEPPTPRMP